MARPQKPRDGERIDRVMYDCPS